MEALLLDTDVFSFFFKRDSRRDLYAGDILGHQLCLSFMTIAELRLWEIERSWPQARREELARALKHYVVLPYDDATAEAWAEVMFHCRRLRRPIACGDDRLNPRLCLLPPALS